MTSLLSFLHAPAALAPAYTACCCCSTSDSSCQRAKQAEEDPPPPNTHSTRTSHSSSIRGCSLVQLRVSEQLCCCGERAHILGGAAALCPSHVCAHTLLSSPTSACTHVCRQRGVWDALQLQRCVVYFVLDESGQVLVSKSATRAALPSTQSACQPVAVTVCGTRLCLGMKRL
jgi:hypothetical protein